MRILFISYWGANEGLTAATVIPHLKILAGFDTVEKIVFCSIEREADNLVSVELPKTIHVPLISKPGANVFLTKLNDFYSFPKQVSNLCSEFRIDLIICRSPLAGGIGFKVAKAQKIPFVVESFEPHAIGMVESGVYKKYDPRFLIGQRFENLAKKYAQFILPVSEHYAQKLLQEGVPENRMIIMPCCIATEHFKFSESKRIRKRTELGYGEENIVGIYVGKFGGIYYDQEAFELYKFAFEFFGAKFRLIILSGDNHNTILQKIQKTGIDPASVFITKADHAQVNEFLSAADFAFSTIRPVPSRPYCSPIKNGEYWSNGLPILLEKGIGDDSDIIAREGGGVILDPINPTTSFGLLKKVLMRGRQTISEEIYAIAWKHRRLELVQESYEKVLAFNSNT